MSAPIVHLLERLRARPPLWLDAEMTEPVRAERDTWIARGWLQPLPPSIHAACPHCPTGAVGPVRMIADRRTGRPTARVACANCGLPEVPEDALRRWQVDVERLAADLARALGSRTPPVMVAESSGWSLGRAAWAGRSRVFFLLRTLDDECISRVHPALERHPRAVILVPTSEESSLGHPLGTSPVIALSEMLSVRDGSLLIDRERLEIELKDIAAGSTRPVKRAASKRGTRSALIEKLCRQLITHLRAAKDHAHDRFQRLGEPKLLPRPSKSKLGALAGLRPDEVTRCFQDPSAQQLRVLWGVADDLDAIMRWGGTLDD